jgi:hypothetical protein
MIRGLVLSLPRARRRSYLVWGTDGGGWVCSGVLLRLNLSLRVSRTLWLCEFWSGSQRCHLLLRWGRP